MTEYKITKSTQGHCICHYSIVKFSIPNIKPYDVPYQVIYNDVSLNVIVVQAFKPLRILSLSGFFQLQTPFLFVCASQIINYLSQYKLCSFLSSNITINMKMYMHLSRVHRLFSLK